MVGGGGGGGNDNGGGGGAGALIYKSARPIGAGTHPVVVGSGGAKGVTPGEANQNGDPGGDTTFDGLTAEGGGGGSGDGNQPHRCWSCWWIWWRWWYGCSNQNWWWNKWIYYLLV